MNVPLDILATIQHLLNGSCSCEWSGHSERVTCLWCSPGSLLPALTPLAMFRPRVRSTFLSHVIQYRRLARAHELCTDSRSVPEPFWPAASAGLTPHYTFPIPADHQPVFLGRGEMCDAGECRVIYFLPVACPPQTLYVSSYNCTIQKASVIFIEIITA